MPTMLRDRQTSTSICLTLATATLLASVVYSQDPQLTSWYTVHSSEYADVVEYVGGTSVTTWPAPGLPNMGGGQDTPAYSDIQQIRYSASWIYIDATGLASHTMGPWYGGMGGGISGLWPSDQMYLIRIPRTPVIPGTKDTVGLGNIGLWVNGVGMYNAQDALSYDTSMAQDRPTMGPGATGDGIWNRNAIAAEVATFDPAYAHQPQNGQYHYHASPLGLRFQLLDNISYNSGSDTYSEDTANLHHSPLLGWAFDGHPVYGPYGYSDANNAASPVTRIRSGYVLRNGANGTTNLSSAGRHSMPAWGATLHGVSQNLSSGQYGPNVNTNQPLGWYVEDFDFLGDLGGTQGTDYDVDRYNGRQCVTPEYPGGTYAYFTTIDASGAPAYPYIIGSHYYGDRTGGNAGTVSESTTTYFLNTGGNASVEGWISF